MNIDVENENQIFLFEFPRRKTPITNGLSVIAKLRMYYALSFYQSALFGIYVLAFPLPYS